MMLSAGFNGDAYRSPIETPAPISFAFWLQPDSLIGLGCIDDSSRHTFACAIHRLMLDGVLLEASSSHLFSPLYRLRTSRYCRGDAVTPCIWGEGLPPSRSSSCQGSMTLPSVPEYCYSFRMNESHQSRCTGTFKLIG
jgi:hypothetical protein